MRPPQDVILFPARDERRKVSRHQEKDQESDEAGFVGDFLAQPARPHEKAANEESCDADRDPDGERGGEPEVAAARPCIAMQKAEVRRLRKVIDGDERERTEAPEHEGVRQARKGALPNYFALQQDFPDEIADTPADRTYREVGIVFRGLDITPDLAEPYPEQGHGGEDEDNEDHLFQPGEVNHLGYQTITGRPVGGSIGAYEGSAFEYEGFLSGITRS